MTEQEKSQEHLRHAFDGLSCGLRLLETGAANAIAESMVEISAFRLSWEFARSAENIGASRRNEF
ncbi:hypothetical protein [Novosphingobium olei]|uniref:Uncharacterized protein n=1 Tax=Novosphingobium olei TaxID=2728851 RepID=A0A7Y0BRB1_9SPHN|nr:hypothetical protein [Novosphingobium olei]NML95145.1 hypothetical protein [Novosphingobium olei]